MIKVICLLCEQETPSKQTEVFSSLIARNNKEALANLGQELGKHIMEKHREELKEIEASIPAWATFMVLRNFEAKTFDGTCEEGSPVDIFEKEKENMRDQLIEQVMRNCDEDEEDLEDDEVDENDEDE